MDPVASQNGGTPRHGTVDLLAKISDLQMEVSYVHSHLRMHELRHDLCDRIDHKMAQNGQLYYLTALEFLTRHYLHAVQCRRAQYYSIMNYT